MVDGTGSVGLDFLFKGRGVGGQEEAWLELRQNTEPWSVTADARWD